MLVNSSINPNSWTNQPTVGSPGKTAPRLLLDVLTYNPYFAGKNIIKELPPIIGSKDAEAGDYKRANHTHELYIKDKQTDDSYRTTSPGCTQTFATICMTCRHHIDVEIEYPENAVLSTCCPNVESPLHHFRFLPKKSQSLGHDKRKDAVGGETLDVLAFECTSTACRVGAKFTISSPRINERYKGLLTSSTDIYRRKERAVRENPEVYEDNKLIPTPTVTKVINTLRTYMKHIANGDAPRQIPWKNRQYLECLGDDCLEIMEHVGFVLDDEANVLVPPVLPIEDIPVQDMRSRLYEDWHYELSALYEHYKAGSGPDERLVQFIPLRAEKLLRETLGCDDYQTFSRRITVIDANLNTIEQLRYGSLGALSDFSDKLLIWAFNRQKACDPKQAPYYFGCFVDLADRRKTEDLQIEVATARSRSEYTLSELNCAFDSLNLPRNTTDENLVIGVFKSRLADAPKQEVELRDSLKMIGNSLNSRLIENETKKLIRDVKHAYTKLGVQDATDASYILTVYLLALSDHPNDAASYTEALKVIAETRRDASLLSFLEANNGYDQSTPLSLEMAFDRLGIQDHQMGDDTIIVVYNLRLNELPGSIADLRAALQVIMNARASQTLAYFLQTGNGGIESPGSADWPVGLMNTGNSCYLNSLLQFYFTIKPLRDVILNYEQYQEDELTPDVLARKRVGGRKLSKAEIERAKQFVGKLQVLFKEMITSKSSKVTPDRELENLALERSPEEFDTRRRSMSLGVNDGMIGPQLPPHLRPDSDGDLVLDMEVDEKPDVAPLKVVNSENHIIDDDTSEKTLVGDSEEVLPAYSPGEDFVVLNDEKSQSHNKENEIPGPIIIEGVEPVLEGERDTDPLLSRTPDEDDDMPELIPDSSGGSQDKITPPAPVRAPPLPPRTHDKPKDKRESSGRMLEAGKQQDVTECIENVMFQIEAALKPDTVQDDGEQYDIVKKLFYGKTKQSLEVPGSVARHKEEYFSHLIVDVAEGNRDIYSALDSIFDASSVDLEGHEARRYLTLSQIPPILQIQIQRVQFDRATGTAFKSNAILKFPETVYFDRYMESEDPAIAIRREESWKWKVELSVLEARQAELTKESEGLKPAEVLDTTRQYLEELNSLGEEDGVLVEPAILLALEQRPEAITSELKTIETKISTLKSRIAQQFTDLRKHGYRIYSVFIHKGSASFGHYWIYIYDFQKHIYRKYNDEYVHEVKDENVVFEDTTANGEATPYFLVFLRNDIDVGEMCQAIYRNLGDLNVSEMSSKIKEV